MEHRLMLDTTAISGFFRGDEQILSHMEAADELYVSPVAIGELLAGFMRGSREKQNRQLLESFLVESRAAVLTIDEETSERYARIFIHLRSSGTPVPTNDIWIAASAMQHGTSILTTDRHYLRIPQVITEWVDS
jgi:tRNA(fMet)-specific endonuclease VapC